MASATNDPTIGKGCQVNINRIALFMDKVKEMTGNQVQEYTVSDNALTSANIENYLNELETKPDDIIWFYYSGHGKNTSTPWPKFLIKGNHLTLKSVHEKLRQKPHRLLISVADCCNFSSSVTSKRTASVDSKATESTSISRGYFDNDSVIKSRYKKLFNETKGEILACGSIPGQFSLYNEYLGGFFTLSLFQSLYAITESSDSKAVNWNNVLRLAKADTEQNALSMGKTQTPQYQLIQPNGTFTTVSQGEVITYTIKSGDTISSVGRYQLKIPSTQISTWLAKVRDLNPQKNLDKIKVGDKVKLLKK